MKDREERTSDYVCVKCGVEYLTKQQKKENSVATFSLGICGMCGEQAATTHIRNYNYLHKRND